MMCSVSNTPTNVFPIQPMIKEGRHAGRNLFCFFIVFVAIFKIPGLSMDGEVQQICHSGIKSGKKVLQLGGGGEEGGKGARGPDQVCQGNKNTIFCLWPKFLKLTCMLLLTRIFPGEYHWERSFSQTEELVGG